MIQGNAINTLRSLQHARDHIGFCPQSNEFLFDNLSFEENYALFGALRGFENAPFPDNMVGRYLEFISQYEGIIASSISRRVPSDIR